MWSWSVAGAPARRGGGGRFTHHLLVGDVTDEADVVRVFNELDPFDIVVANAGAAELRAVHGDEHRPLAAMLAVNVTGVFLTFREGLRQTRGRGWGRLITVASTAGLKGYSYARPTPPPSTVRSD